MNINTGTKKQGVFYYDIVSKTTEATEQYRELLADYVNTEKIDSKEKLECAITYLKAKAGNQLILAEFEKESGVGIDTSEAEVQKSVADFLALRRTELLEQRYQISMSN